ncbi:MAG: zinc ribbon domain-containing protein [Candidatus Hodarchaeales archaeon]|jgi:hypothetical protein
MIQQLLTILDEGDHMTDGFGMMGGGWWMWIMIIGGMFIIPFLAIWTYQDAQQYGENAALWALVVFFTMGFGIILYVLVRNPNRSDLSVNPQPSPPRPSQNSSRKTVTYSPPTQYNQKTEWGNKGGFCENCGAPLTVTDSFCSKCGTPVGST